MSSVSLDLPFARRSEPLEECLPHEPIRLLPSSSHPAFRERDELVVTPFATVYDVVSFPQLERGESLKANYVPERFLWTTDEKTQRRLRIPWEEERALRKTLQFKVIHQVFSGIDIDSCTDLHIPTSEVYVELVFFNCQFFEGFQEVLSRVPATSVTFRKCDFIDIQSFRGMFPRTVRHVRFFNCHALKLESMRKMFDKLWNLERVEFRGNDFRALRDISYMFRECSSMKYVDGLYDLDVSRVKKARNIFECCSALVSLHGLDLWRTDNFESLVEMCACCYHLEDFSALRGWRVDELIDASSAFLNTAMTNTADLLYWRPEKLMCAANMFRGSKVNTLAGLCFWRLDDGVIADHMFSGTQVVSLEGIESLITGSMVKARGMFFWCKELTDVSAIYNWEASGVVDASDLFRYCARLRDIDLHFLARFTSLADARGMVAHTAMRYAEGLEVLLELPQKIDVAGMFYRTNVPQRETFERLRVSPLSVFSREDEKDAPMIESLTQRVSGDRKEHHKEHRKEYYNPHAIFSDFGDRADVSVCKEIFLEEGYPEAVQRIEEMEEVLKQKHAERTRIRRVPAGDPRRLLPFRERL